ncbi:MULTISPECIES: DUF4214 domain-containing protein [Sphingobium]|uniref:DUF4214 domain-containing protein n=1 Tax=Sphingobium TaxID=165695 RepID=UPI0015EBF1CD|nr:MULTISPECIES: DUF4214 domain-containing protein [Sphingobium]MCW2361387.1 hypothetical protein [Sphingobium sp. B10D3B]MCW2401934.1 hypothetical protein [Sphingobium sp. B10D7B]MCW2408913.1 hypothetical protein [Sphingobium xanthum]
MLQSGAPADENIVHASYFFAFYDAEFVDQVYHKLLKRPPDPTGGSHYVAAIRAGDSRYQILDSIFRSAEAREQGVQLIGMSRFRRRRKLYAIPVIGKLAQMIAFLRQVDAVRRDLRALENHLYRLSNKIGDL